jgi:hypothetical protein
VIVKVSQKHLSFIKPFEVPKYDLVHIQHFLVILKNAKNAIKEANTEAKS